MAKVMVSVPDDLLKEVDTEAARLGTSRSAVLGEFAASELRRRRRRDRAKAMETLLRQPKRVKATR
jgi:metal-responsive CopG/Arc/MetJ family transcriptional regulator